MRREPPGLATHANNVFIVNDDDVMVVDTSQSPALTREVLAALRKITLEAGSLRDQHPLARRPLRRRPGLSRGVPGRRHRRATRRRCAICPAKGRRTAQQMVKGLPSMIEQMKDALATGRNLAGARDHRRGTGRLCERHRVGRAIRQRGAGRAGHHCRRWRERSADAATRRTRDRHPVVRPGTQPGRPDRPSAGREDRDRRRSGDLAGSAGRAEVVHQRLGAALERIRALQPASSSRATARSCGTTVIFG